MVTLICGQVSGKSLATQPETEEKVDRTGCSSSTPHKVGTPHQRRARVRAVEPRVDGGVGPSFNKRKFTDKKMERLLQSEPRTKVQRATRPAPAPPPATVPPQPWPCGHWEPRPWRKHPQNLCCPSREQSGHHSIHIHNPAVPGAWVGMRDR